MDDRLAALKRAGHNVQELLKDPGRYMSVAQVGPVTAFETYQRLGIPITLKELKKIYHRIENKQRFKGMKLIPQIRPEKPERVPLPLNILRNHKIPVQDLLGAFKVILGTTGTGKSNTVAVMIEEYIKYNIPVHIIDVEGEHLSFVEELGFKLLNKKVYSGFNHKDEHNLFKTDLAAFLKGILSNRQNLEIDLSSFDQKESWDFLKDYLDTLWVLEDKMKVPLSMIIEEVHTLVPQSRNTPVKQVLQDFAKRGRKRKIEVTFVTQRSQEADKSVITQAEVGFLHRTTHPADREIYRILIPDKELFYKVDTLQKGEVIYVNKGAAIRDMVRLRKTKHGAHTITVEDLNLPKGVRRN